MRRLLLRAGLLLAGAVLGLVLAEWIVRAVDPFGASYYRDFTKYRLTAWDLANAAPPDQWDDHYIYRHLPGLELELHTFEIATNEIGFRSTVPGEAVPPPGRERALRVLCLGDSTTFAWGVNDADSWPRHLERDGRASDGRPLEVLNGGHLVYDSVQEAALLRAVGAELRPELVLVMFNYNDLNSTAQSLRDELAAQAGIAAPTGLAKTWQSARNEVLGYFPGLLGLAEYRKHAPISAAVERHELPPLEELTDYPGSWPRVEAALDDMRATCEALGATLVVMDHSEPVVPDVEPWCARSGVPFVDVRFTPEEWDLDVRCSAADAHANERGNRIIADKVLAALAELELVTLE